MTLVRNLKNLFWGRRQRKRITVTRNRIRLRGLEDRQPPTKLTVGPAEKFDHGLLYINPPCWLVKFEGPGYVDYNRCYMREAVDSCVAHFKWAYPNLEVEYLE